ncbi:hypothetical protein ASPFODRAFT_392136 [Aspergillus luchuensis CBS 106.47]|uniref:Uncharacterized protein n=1 Tax=Aspergillus luchuensis (strain CBS 106.47) TaxID=1137211 RepID=A0A1M3T3S9_ASPLC|nr:hypothetical protein ASPFODRAFT_392136 [Aspergillus luchuensis CBS 106.47]
MLAYTYAYKWLWKVLALQIHEHCYSYVLVWSSTFDSDTIKRTILLLTVLMIHLKLYSHDIPSARITVTVGLEICTVILAILLLR